MKLDKVICLLFASAIYSNVHACEFKVGFETWVPYQSKSAAGKFEGLDVEVLEAVAKEAGCGVQFVDMPWNRQLASAESGELDVVMGAAKTPEREVFANYSDDYRTEANVLFVKKGMGADVKELNDLPKTKLKIGVVRGSSYGPEIDAMKAKFDGSADVDDANLKKMIANRLDATIMDEYSGMALIKSLNAADKIEKHPVKFSVAKSYFLVSKKAKDSSLSGKLNEALKKISANGTVAKILAKYK